jgi:hypothetical protein
MTAAAIVDPKNSRSSLQGHITSLGPQFPKVFNVGSKLKMFWIVVYFRNVFSPWKNGHICNFGFQFKEFSEFSEAPGKPSGLDDI